MKRTAQVSHRKRPHILPPLPTAQGASPSFGDTLHPPSTILFEGRLGSPAPRWKRPASEDTINLPETLAEGKPLIRIAPAIPEDNDQRRKDSLKFDLKNDPIFKADNQDRLVRLQRRNSTRKGNSIVSTLEAVKRMKGTAEEGHNDKELSFTSRRATQILENNRKKDVAISGQKPAHFNSRYALLKPIRKASADKSSKK